MRIEHVVPAEGYDRYPSFYLATGLTEERWVRAVEIACRDLVKAVRDVIGD